MDNISVEKQALKILFLASEPSNSAKMHLGKELQEVRNRVSSNANFEIKDRQAVKTDDVLQTILDYKPHIVHFSGHGQDSGEICFEDETGKSKVVSPEALASLFSLVNEHVKCVIVNTCYAEAQARAIAQFIPIVIGTRNEITDTAAIEFSKGFYTALEPDLSQISLKNAFKRGCVSIQLFGLYNEHLTPVLIEGSAEVRFSSEVDSAFAPITGVKGVAFKALLRGLTLTGIKMGLTTETATRIMEEKMNKLQAYNDSVAEYEKYLVEILKDEFPLSDSSTAALLQLQKGLDLSNDVVAFIKNKILSNPSLNTAENWYDRGRGQSDLGNFERAIEYYTNAIEKDNDYSGAYFERGYNFDKLEKFDLAIKDFNKAIEFNNKWEFASNLSLAYYSKGLAYFSIRSDDEKLKSENLTNALENWTKSVELNPNEPNAYYNMGLVHEYFKNVTDAITAFKKAFDMTSNPKTKANSALSLVRVYNFLNNAEESKTWSDTALAFSGGR